MVSFVFARFPSVAYYNMLLLPWYVGVVQIVEGHDQAQRTNTHTKVEFEWILSCPTSTATERVEVWNNNVKRRGVPLPDAWTHASMAHLQKMCAATTTKAMRELPDELHGGGATLSCQLAP